MTSIRESMKAIWGSMEYPSNLWRESLREPIKAKWGSMKSIRGVYEGEPQIYKGIHGRGSMKSISELFEGIHEIQMRIHVIYNANL